MFAVDFHVHTRASSDGLDAPERVVRAARDAGLDAIAITDHDTDAGYRRLCDLGLADPSGRPVDGFLVIPGVEVSTKEGHVLVLGRAFRPEPGLTSHACLRIAHAMGAIGVAAHPFDKFRSGVGRATLERVGFDAIETWNAKTIDHTANHEAEAWATEHALPAVGGSDAHHARCVGRAHTLVQAHEFTVAGVIDGVLASRVDLVRASHSKREIAHYLIRGWLTRPWLLDRARRTLAAKRSARRVEPASVPVLPIAEDEPVSASAREAFDLREVRERRIAQAERARTTRAHART